MTEQIRTILGKHASLGVDAGAIDEAADLYAAGMTSHATVNVMLALESAFDVEFPDRMLRARVFGSIASIKAAVEELTRGR
jgi:acyl carrier protein